MIDYQYLNNSCINNHFNCNGCRCNLHGQNTAKNPPKIPNRQKLPTSTKTPFAKNPTKILGTRLHHFDAFPTFPTIYFFCFFSRHPFKYRRKSRNRVTALIINTLIAYPIAYHDVPKSKIALPKILKFNFIILY